MSMAKSFNFVNVDWENWESKFEAAIVKDVPSNKQGCKKIKIVFVLESPTDVEIEAGHPAAFTTGKTMSRVLFGQEQECVLPSLGRLLSGKHAGINKSLVEKFSKIAIVNVSPFPLQPNHFPCDIRQEFNDQWSTIEKVLTSLRENPAAKYLMGPDRKRHDELTMSMNSLRTILEQSLRNRILSFSEATIVPCGDCAREFVKRVPDIQKVWSREAPHPSYGHWDQDDEFVRDMKKLIAEF